MLKKQRRYLLGMLLMAVLFFAKGSSLTALANLDEIEEYTIQIEPYQDGSLRMTYHLKWRVLDSVSEGPLEWVKIGIPNENAEDFEALSDNIQKIGYYSQGGDYVRLDLDRSYYAGEVVELDFRFHQHCMYEKEGGIRKYSFTPGWFPDIQVDKLNIYWQDWKVESASGAPAHKEGYYHYRTSLKEGERFSVIIRYYDAVFSKEDSKVISFRNMIPFLVLVCFPLLTCLVLLIFSNKIAAKIRESRGQADTYTKHSGMGSVHHVHHYTGGHGGGGGCACACACACAGGGRAGCSKKDFYGTKLETQRIRRALQAEAKLSRKEEK